MNKIKNLSIKGLRGIKKEISFPLDGKSILLYGENGSGKSSFTDALEWFYYDKIEHLSSEEIGRKGIEGLRNIHMDDTEDGSIKIDYSDSKFNSSKTINPKLSTDYTNTSADFVTFLQELQKEQIILRYRDLVHFILATKGEKLTALSEIIGFSEVIKTRDVLRKSFKALKKDIKSYNFEAQINYQQNQIIEQLEQNVVSDDQYFGVLNTILNKIALGKTVSKFEDIDSILELLKTSDNTQIIEKQVFLEKIKTTTNQLLIFTVNIKKDYENYYKQYQVISADIEKLNKIKLGSLLTEGERILKDEIIKEEVCPLCLQPKKKIELLRELQIRIDELQKYKEEKNTLDVLKSGLLSELTKCENSILNILNDTNIELEENKLFKIQLLKTNEELKNYQFEVKKDILKDEKLIVPKELIINNDNFIGIEKVANEQIELLKESKKDDDKFDLHSKIVLSKNAYLDIKKLKKSKKLIENQQYTLEKIYSAFIKKMESGFESFLTHLSKDINDLYIFMNPGEHIEDISLVSLQKNDEFSGITIQFKFYDNEITPPNKYLSESHLNCLGIAFYLTSVKTFNKTNKFFVMDDVISSFDKTHRARFAHLLNEKFSDYQIILLTHEKDWFDYVSKLVKGKNWLINTFKHVDKEGPSIDVPLPSLKEQIENQIKTSDMQSLGNNIRRYLECLLKEISNKIGILMRFQYNDKNEDRMPNEMLTSLRSHLNKHPNVTIDCVLVDRLISSVFIGNKDSHDGSYTVSIGDCKAFWADVMELEKQYHFN
jgi:energy-coupling factor transporter ATP-binding protein EcfA2